MDNFEQRREPKLIPVTFGDGPLGVTLRRRPENGVVFVFDIVENSQAVDMDINIGDELWAIGASEIGEVALDKEAWNGLVQYIKYSPRPLKAVWRRQQDSCEANQVDEEDDDSVHEQSENSDDPVIEETMEVPQRSSRNISTTRNNQEPLSKSERPADLSEADCDLQELSNRLYLKEKEKASFASGFAAITKRSSETSAVHLMKKGREILRIGELETTSKAPLAMWATQNKRQFILLTDILIIAIATGATLQVEYMIDLPVCKLLCDAATSKDGGGSSSSESNRLHSTFQLIWPGGNVQVTAGSPEERNDWVENVFSAICDCVEADSSHVLGWRHQYMQGSMHSAVISRDENKVKELILKCESGLLSFTVIESLDEDGYSPLHYACILRLPAIIKALSDTGADSTMADGRGLTALHWAALQLDHQALSILCQHVVDIDTLDHKGRTPLYLACVEGRDVSGRTDMKMLTQCVKTILAHDPDVDFRDEEGYTILHYLAAGWQVEPLRALLDHSVKPNIYCIGTKDGMNALHYACDASPLKRATGEGCWLLSNASSSSKNAGDEESSPPLVNQPLEDLLIEDGVPTLKALLQAGSRPNVKDGAGRHPLQLVAQSAEVYGNRFGGAVDTLLTFGARFIDEFPESSVIKLAPDVSIEESISEWAALSSVDADDLEINKTPHSKFSDFRSSGKERDRDKLCALCDFKFTMFKRQHHCRLCDIVCCDECSKKKAVVEGSQVRCCDSCYNYLVREGERKRTQSTLKQAILKSRSQSIPPNTSASRQAAGKKDLFGSAVTFPANRDGSDSKTSSGISGAMSSLSEAHDRLMERGEKLNKLNDKSADVANAAEEFSKLAKQLNEQQKNRWF